jgi:hypothetical protein
MCRWPDRVYNFILVARRIGKVGNQFEDTNRQESGTVQGSMFPGSRFKLVSAWIEL